MQPVFIPAVWKLYVPPKIHVFLWLFSYNELMTRDNLSKRGFEKSHECVYCSERESIQLLFFECVVAKQICESVSDFFSCSLGADYLSIAKFWIANKKHTTLNSICACVLWAIWKHRNSCLFRNVMWIDLKQIWNLMMGLLRRWLILLKDDARVKMEGFMTRVILILSTPFQITTG